MRTITVDVANLKVVLANNLTNHRSIFEQALEAFRLKAIDVFEAQIASVRSGKMPEVHLRLPIPEEHTDDYKRAIEMLTWHTEDTIELTEAEFRQYVQDDWGWRQSFTSNTTAYLAT